LGLHKNIQLCTNLRYHITSNIDICDGLVNGAVCTLKRIDYNIHERPTSPGILWVLFDEASIGKQMRSYFRTKFPAEVRKNWTPITMVQRTIYPHARHRNVPIIRTQFPLQQASATTYHKAQGQTLKELIPLFEAKTLVAQNHSRRKSCSTKVLKNVFC